MDYIFIAQYYDYEYTDIYYVGTNLKDAFDKVYNKDRSDSLNLTIYIGGTNNKIFDTSICDDLTNLKSNKIFLSNKLEYRDIFDELELLIDENIKELEETELARKIEEESAKVIKELEELHRLQEKYKDRSER